MYKVCGAYSHLHSLVGIGIEIEALPEILASFTSGEVNMFNDCV